VLLILSTCLKKAFQTIDGKCVQFNSISIIYYKSVRTYTQYENAQKNCLHNNTLFYLANLTKYYLLLQLSLLNLYNYLTMNYHYVNYLLPILVYFPAILAYLNG